MRARHDSFIAVFRAADPLGSDDFRLLCDQVAATPDPKLLQEFLAALNRDLVRRVESGAAGDADVGRQSLRGPHGSESGRHGGRGRDAGERRDALVPRPGDRRGLRGGEPGAAAAGSARGPRRHREPAPAVQGPRDGGAGDALARHGRRGRHRARGAVRAPLSQRHLRGARARARQGERRVLRALGGGVRRAQPALSRDPGRPRGARVGRGGARRARGGADGIRDPGHGPAHPPNEHAAAGLASRAARRRAGRRPFPRGRRAHRGQGDPGRAGHEQRPLAGLAGRLHPARAPAERRALAVQRARARGRARRFEPAAPRPRGGGRAPLRAHRGQPRAAAVAGRRAVCAALSGPVSAAGAAERDARGGGGAPGLGGVARLPARGDRRRLPPDPVRRHRAMQPVRDRPSRMVRAPPLHEALATSVRRRPAHQGGCDEDLPGSGGIPEQAGRDGGRRHRGAHPR